MSDLELPQSLTEKDKIAVLVKETLESLAGKSCYEPDIVEAVKAVAYKDNDKFSSKLFAETLVSKLKEEKIIKNEAELKSIQTSVESALDRVSVKKSSSYKNN